MPGPAEAKGCAASSEPRGSVNGVTLEARFRHFEESPLFRKKHKVLLKRGSLVTAGARGKVTGALLHLTSSEFFPPPAVFLKALERPWTPL